MKIRGILLSFTLLFTACAEDGDLEWVAPLDVDQVPVGDAIELAVATQHPDAKAVRFSLDGTELAVCDPAQADEDCKRDDVWRWTTVFSQPGMHGSSRRRSMATASRSRASRARSRSCPR